MQMDASWQGMRSRVERLLRTSSLDLGISMSVALPAGTDCGFGGPSVGGMIGKEGVKEWGLGDSQACRLKCRQKVV